MMAVTSEWLDCDYFLAIFYILHFHPIYVIYMSLCICISHKALPIVQNFFKKALK